MTVAPEDVRVELARILEFEGIRNSAMLASFLTYVVEETLAGREDRLKAYTIAVEALDRPENFDPNDSPLVRVQARRLRDVLSRFYADPENESAIRIEIPTGSYVPRFAPNVAASLPPAPKRDPMRFMPGLFAFLAIAGSCVLAVLVWDFWKTKTPRAHADRLAAINTEYPAGTGRDAASILPQVFVSVTERGNSADWFDPVTYRNRIELFVQAFSDYIIVRAESEARALTRQQPTYKLEFTFQQEGGVMHGTVQVVSVRDGRLIFASELDLTRSDSGIYRLGSAMMTPVDLAEVRTAIDIYGPIYQDYSNAAESGGPLECLTRAGTYFAAPSEERHLAARDCLELTIVAHPRLHQALVLLGGIYLDEETRGFNPTPGDPRERARAAFDKAERIAPGSAIVHLFRLSLLLLEGRIETARDLAEHAYEHNPEDMVTLGSYGRLLVQTGAFRDATEVLRRADANFQNSPDWVNFYTFVAMNGLGRFTRAEAFANKLSESSDPLYLAAYAIAQHRTGFSEIAVATISRIRELDAGFLNAPMDYLRKRGFTEPVIEELVQEMRMAGFPLPVREARVKVADPLAGADVTAILPLQPESSATFHSIS